MFCRKLLAYMFIAMYCSVSAAQVVLPESIRLNDAIQATLEFNPQLDSFPLRQDALAGQRETASLNPAFNFESEIESVLGSGDLSGVNAAELTLAISSVVEMGDKREARLETVNRRIDILDTEQRVLELDLIAETTFRFIDLAAAQERLRLQGEASELARQTLTLLQPLTDAGQAPQMELLRADAALRRALLSQANAEAILDSAKIRLASMWGSQAPGFNSVVTNFLEAGSPGTLNTLLAGLENNPNIALYASESRLLEARLREVQAQQRSDLQWSAGVKHSRELEDTGLVFGLSIPINSTERSAGARRSAQASLAEVAVRQESGLNTLRGQLFALHRQLVQATDEAQVLQQEVLPLLTESLDLTRQAYQNGLYSYVELVGAQREYLDAELALINTLTNAHTLRAEIERLSGQPLGSP